MKHSRWKNGKQNRRFLVSAVILFLILHTLTGCIPNNFTTEEKNAFLQEAREVASDYLSDRYSGAFIREIQPDTEVVDAEYALTEYASGQFAWQKQTYDFLVNTETGEVYTSVYLEEVRERLKELLLRELGIACEEAAVVDCSIYYLKGARKIGWSCWENIFPEEESAEELLEKILQDTETYEFSMRLQYKGENLSLEMMEQAVPYPTLTSVTLYHVKDEFGLCREKYASLNLPSLSEEILTLRKNTASYTRYQTLEQDGYLVIYNAYERERERDTVTESVITEEDITLTVTDEFIRLDCTKDDYSMYLATKEKDLIKKYLHVWDYTTSLKNRKTTKGMWYPFEDGYYIYVDSVYSTVPYEFHQRYYERDDDRNVIYRSPQKK